MSKRLVLMMSLCLAGLALFSQTRVTVADLVMMPAWATTRLPEVGAGYLDFDVRKAREYTSKKAKYISATFNEAVERWERMESWK